MTAGNSDYELAWPRELFRAELAALVNSASRSSGWKERVELLLADAFTTSVPRDDFLAAVTTDHDPWAKQPAARGDGRAFLVDLLRRADAFPLPKERAPYWSERRTGSALPGVLSIGAVAREFQRIVADLDARGYFELEFGKDCVDDPAVAVPSDIIQGLVGRPGMWPPDPDELAADPDALCDLIEVLHDLVARPRNRWLHSYAQCGWHHSDYARHSGQIVYRWRVNRLLERSDLGLRLADEGEDAGRLTHATDDARGQLVQRALHTPDEATRARVRHAIALFRSRSATEHEKRSAAMVLALVLEERRALLKEELLSKDERALFEIANGFAIRHQRENQRADYSPAFRDWVFWWYLATIELTNRIMAERTSKDLTR